METKEEIRARIKALRDRLSPETRHMASERIAASVISHEWFEAAEDIYCYTNIGSEAETGGIIREAWRRGKRVWLPAVSGGEMDFLRYTETTELAAGRYGIPEPADGPAADGRSGLAIVPGVAFDRAGNRVGYGGGYYDRYLAAHPGLLAIAVAFEAQVTDGIDTGDEDIPVDILITESAVYSAD